MSPSTPTPTPTSSPTGPIVGGVVAGVVAIAAIATFAWYKTRIRQPVTNVELEDRYVGPPPGQGGQLVGQEKPEEADAVTELPTSPALRYPEQPAWPERDVSERVGGRLSAGY